MRLLRAAHFAMSKLQDSRELLNNLRAYCTRWGSNSFDFGEYNDLDRNQAVKGSALAQNAQYLEAFLKAGYAKASLVTMRNTLRLLESHFLGKFKVNPTEKSFEDFLAFLCRRSNCMLSHLRRLVNEEKMNTCVRGLADPKDADTLHTLLQLLNEVVVPSPSPSPGEAPKEEVAKEGQDPRTYPTYESLVRSPSSMPASDSPGAAPSSDDDNAPRSALQQARNRQGKLPGTRGSTKEKTKQMRKPAAAKPPAAEAADPAKSPCRVGKFSHKGYVQVFDTDSNAWKLLVNVDYTNCSEEWKSKCHEVLDKLLAYVQNKPESTKEELRSKRNDWLQAAEHGDVASSRKRPAASSLRPKKASRKAHKLKSKDDPEMPAVSPKKIRRRSNLLSSPGNIDQGDSLSFSDFGSFA